MVRHRLPRRSLVHLEGRAPQTVYLYYLSVHMPSGRTAMARARQDGAPTGTPYQCFICGYDTRSNPWSKVKDNHGRPADDSVGEYVPGIGVRHKTVQDCSKIMTYYLDQKFDLSRVRHPEGVES